MVAKAHGLPLRTRALLDFLSRWFAQVDWERPGERPDERAPSRTRRA